MQENAKLYVKMQESHLAFFTGESLEVIASAEIPILDVHMHIQSNDCAPLPLQWGLLSKMACEAFVHNEEMINKVMGVVKGVNVAKYVLEGLLVIPLIVNLIHKGSGKRDIVESLVALLDLIKKYDISNFTNEVLTKMDRVLMNDIQASLTPAVHEFGKLGTISSDNVAKLFMGQTTNLETRTYGLSKKSFAQLKDLFSLENDSDIMGFLGILYGIGDRKMDFGSVDSAKAREMAESRLEIFRKKYEVVTKYYYDMVKPNHMFNIMPMDLEYGHYWGYFHLPMYLKKDEEEYYFFNNNFYYLSIYDNLAYTADLIDEKLSTRKIERFREKVRDKLEKIEKRVNRWTSKITEWIDDKLEDFRELEYKELPDDRVKEIDDFQDELKEIRSELLKNRHGEYSHQGGYLVEKGYEGYLRKDVEETALQIIKDYEAIEAGDSDEFKAFHYIKKYLPKWLDNLYDKTKDRMEKIRDLFDDEIKDLVKKARHHAEGMADNIPEEDDSPRKKKRLRENYQTYYDLWEKLLPEFDKKKKEILSEKEYFLKTLSGETELLQDNLEAAIIGLRQTVPYNIKFKDHKKYFRFRAAREIDFKEGSVVHSRKDKLLGTVYYQSGSWSPDEEGEAVLQRIAADLEEDRKKFIEKYKAWFSPFYYERELLITGHTGDHENKAWLEQLSTNRAKSAAAYLVNEPGIYEKVTEIEGRSYQEPSAAGGEKNWRAEVWLIDGGGDPGDSAYEEFLGKKYNHFLQEAPSGSFPKEGEEHPRTEMDLFECYKTHYTYVMASILRFPFKMFGFYHYDPRRHYSESTGLEPYVKDIRKNHQFFTCEPGGLNKPKITPLDLSYDYLEAEMKRNRQKNGYVFDKLVQKNKKESYNKGLFFGMKMYTELGYAPDLYQNDRVQGYDFDHDRLKNRDVYPLLYENELKNRYQHLYDFFKHCETNDIPITCHGSAKGMTIADTTIYHRTGAGKYVESSDFKNILVSQTAADVLEGLNYVDRMFVGPSNWARVLDDFPGLRLNLAHYTGESSWKGTKEGYQAIGGKEFSEWRHHVSLLAATKKNFYVDISCYYNDYEAIVKEYEETEFEKLIRSIESSLGSDEARYFNARYDKKVIYIQHQRIVTYKLKKYLIKNPGVSEDAELYRMKRILFRAELSGDSLVAVGEALAKMIIALDINGSPPVNKSEWKIGGLQYKLRDKIMMGSDWPMFELQYKSVGEYYCRMFEQLALITKRVEEADKARRFDAWYQFSVINPARFTGLLEEDEKSLNEEKVKAHEEAILHWLKSDTKEQETWLDNARITARDIKRIKSVISENKEKLLKVNKTQLKPADKILDPDDADKGDDLDKSLLILKTQFDK